PVRLGLPKPLRDRRLTDPECSAVSRPDRPLHVLILDPSTPFGGQVDRGSSPLDGSSQEASTRVGSADAPSRPVALCLTSLRVRNRSAHSRHAVPRLPTSIEASTGSGRRRRGFQQLRGFIT